MARNGGLGRDHCEKTSRCVNDGVTHHQRPRPPGLFSSLLVLEVVPAISNHSTIGAGRYGDHKDESLLITKL